MDGSDGKVALPLVEYERIKYVAQLPHITGDVLYETPNRACLWRVETFYDKEPDTVAWIETFNPGEVFVDVGANMGLYSIWAAKTAGVRVFAFEPEAQNFALLCRNIALNKVAIQAFPLALSDEARVSTLYLTSQHAGSSCHQFGQAVDFKGEPMKPQGRQGAVSATLDGLCDDKVLPRPDHIKIDVDGIEHLVLRGAQRCLANHAKSVLVEVNTNLEDHSWIMDAMVGYGFETDVVQMDAARRKEGAFKGVGNVIFRRR